MKKLISLLLPFIGLGIFVAIVIGIGPGRIADAFRSVQWAKLWLLPFLVLFIIIIRGYRWQFLMRMLGIEYSLSRSTAVWVIGFFAAAITPAKLGDAIRAYYVSRETGRQFGECFLTVFIDRLMDLLVVLLMGAVTVLVFSYHYIEISSMWIVVVSVVGLFAMTALVLHKGLMRRLLKPIFHLLFPKKYKDQLSLTFNTFYDSLGDYVKRWQGTVFAFLLTVVYWFTVFTFAYYVAYVLDIDVSFSYIFIIMPLVTLVELAPISISGVGIREAAVIFFFSVVGLSSAEAVGFSVAYLVTGTYLTALVGFFLWLKHPVKLGRG